MKNMEKILNFRTLASGLKNRHGEIISPNVIFRSGDINSASQADIESITHKKIQTIYDLRSQVEIGSPTEGLSLKTIHIEIIKKALQNDFKALMGNSKSQNEKFMIDLYAVEFVGTTGFNEVMKEIISKKNDSFLFHCTAGKDRTGILGVILMMIFDFDIETIKEEYLIIDKDLMIAVASKITFMLRSDMVQIPQNLEPMFLVNNSYISAFIFSIKNKYGSIDNYIKVGLGISDKKKEILKAKYLTTCI